MNWRNFAKRMGICFALAVVLGIASHFLGWGNFGMAVAALLISIPVGYAFDKFLPITERTTQ